MTNEEIVEQLKIINVYKSKLQIYLRNHFVDLNNAIFENTNFLDKLNRKVTFSERLYCIKNDMKSP